MTENPFRNEFAERIFHNKYKHEMAETWQELSETLVNEVANSKLSPDEKSQLIQYVSEMKFIPGGRYLYYAGRPHKFYNNCYLMKAEADTREDWAQLSWKSESALLTGGGIGIDYSIYRPSGSPIRKTGGFASGPIPKMMMINEIGRRVMQGGSRRSAIYGSLNWQHGDIQQFLASKDWGNRVIDGAFDEYGNKATVAYLKEKNFDYPAELDMTNISVNYDTAFLEELYELSTPQIYNRLKAKEELEFKRIPKVYLENVRQALSHGEPGFSFNFFEKENETLRNACTEVTSEDDSDVCNLGSVNMSRIDTMDEFKDVVRLAAKFLLCGTTAAQLPYEKVYEVRSKNRRLGLGLMGVHEWLLKRGHRYEMNDDLKDWLYVYKLESERAANELADKLSLSRPVAYRSIAPTGTIALIANTSSGIEPIYATSYKRRYLRGKSWRYQYVIDGTAKTLIDQGVSPSAIETSIELAADPERRVQFQADIQDYVDMAISSTINLPEWGTDLNNDNHVSRIAKTILKYSHRLRGLTVYPNGSRGGQPITPVDYELAQEKEGREFSEEYVDVCDLTGGGVCGS
jgi:ribonucleoside-diphosphate reductase alpha chain